MGQDNTSPLRRGALNQIPSEVEERSGGSYRAPDPGDSTFQYARQLVSRINYYTIVML